MDVELPTGGDQKAVQIMTYDYLDQAEVMPTSDDIVDGYKEPTVMWFTDSIVVLVCVSEDSRVVRFKSYNVDSGGSQSSTTFPQAAFDPRPVLAKWASPSHLNVSYPVVLVAFRMEDGRVGVVVCQILPGVQCHNPIPMTTMLKLSGIR